MTAEQRELAETLLDLMDALAFTDSQAVAVAGLIARAAIRRAQLKARTA